MKRLSILILIFVIVFAFFHLAGITKQAVQSLPADEDR
jgi:hypothetical protein